MPDSLLQGLSVAVAVMLIVVLYHVLFIVVDLRKIVRRIEGITEELETVILKPLAMTDKAIDWVVHHLEHSKKHHKHQDDAN